MSKSYQIMDASETKTLTVVQVGKYADGCKDFAVHIEDDEHELAYAEFDEIDDPYEITEWAQEQGFEFAEHAEKFAAHVIDNALIREVCSVDAAASREWAKLGR